MSFAAIAAMTAVSCNKEIETPDYGTDATCPEGYYVEELTAVYPRDPETRTAFNETTGRFAWTEGDELAFHLSNGEYVAAPIDPATGKVKLYLPVGVTRDNYAVYPASAVVDEAAAIGNMKVTLPDTYDISADPNTDFVPTPLVAWNDAENTHLKFEHVGGLLQVNLTVPAGVKTATVSMGKTITGTFSLEDGTGNGIISPGAASVDGVTFVLSESGLTESTDVKLLTPLPTGTYDSFEIAYDNGFEFSKDLSANPWTFSRSGGKKVSISEDKFEDVRELETFWMKALDAGSTVSFTPTTRFTVKLYYSINDRHASNFVEWDFSPITLENEDDIVYFYGENATALSNLGSGTTYTSSFATTGRLKIGGPIVSLYAKDYASSTINKGYAALFKNNTAIIDASELILPTYMSGGKKYTPQLHSLFYGCSNLVAAPEMPAESVSNYGYASMYSGCTSLTEAPELLTVTSVGSSAMEYMFSNSGIIVAPEFNSSLTRINNKSCFGMFYGCKSLTTIVNLPFKDVRSRGCEEMFENCTALTATPEITVTKVETDAMRSMFYGCSNLASTTSRLPAMTLATRCYANMYQGCKKLTVAPELPATTIAASCYSWMFLQCDLRSVPRLPATTVYDYSYEYMFGQNKNLTSVPSDLLPAMTLGTASYKRMFMECSKLKNAPDLPATTLTTGCYMSMFRGCNSLNAPIELPATDITPMSCYAYMFYGCSSLNNVTVGFSEWPSNTAKSGDENGVEAGPTYRWFYAVTNTEERSFSKPTALSEVRDSHHIPANWTVVNL